MKRRNKMTKRISAVLLTGVMLVSILVGVPAGEMREVEAATTLQNPKRDSNNVVTWDCVYFGNYPQSDATGKTKDPIKWRVLSVDGNDAFLIADQILDVQPFNETYVEVTWETCTIRSWLNGYGSGSNVCGIDYSSNNFIDKAFSESEQTAIKTVTVDNSDVHYTGTDGGNSTRDKIYFPSWIELTTAAYGFSEGPTGDGYFADRVRTNTNYAYQARNITEDVSFTYKNTWNTRVMSYANLNIMTVYSGGEVTEGTLNESEGVCPVLHLDISNSNVWVYAGTVSSDGTINEENNTTSEENIRVSKIKISGVSKKLAAGKKVKLTATITPSNASNKKVKWTSSNKKYATVNQKGQVTLKKKGAGKTVKITATATDGSNKKATYEIKIMKHAVKKVTINGKKSRTIKAGKSLKFKTKVTTTGKSVNKKIKWTTSNKKYATVTQSGKVETKKAGKGKTVKITAMATDGSGKKAVVRIKLK